MNSFYCIPSVFPRESGQNELFKSLKCKSKMIKYNLNHVDILAFSTYLFHLTVLLVKGVASDFTFKIFSVLYASAFRMEMLGIFFSFKKKGILGIEMPRLMEEDK